jgi:hypothetical protein
LELRQLCTLQGFNQSINVTSVAFCTVFTIESNTCSLSDCLSSLTETMSSRQKLVKAHHLLSKAVVLVADAVVTSALSELQMATASLVNQGACVVLLLYNK